MLIWGIIFCSEKWVHLRIWSKVTCLQANLLACLFYRESACKSFFFIELTIKIIVSLQWHYILLGKWVRLWIWSKTKCLQANLVANLFLAGICLSILFCDWVESQSDLVVFLQCLKIYSANPRHYILLGKWVRLWIWSKTKWLQANLLTNIFSGILFVNPFSWLSSVKIPIFCISSMPSDLWW